VLVVERESKEPLERVELRTLATVGAQIALLAENLRLVDDLRSTFDASIEAIASAVEARDGYTESHCRRLAIFSVSMADRLGLPAEEIEAIRLGALLHDVGKIGVRDEVLLKPGRFTPEERRDGHGVRTPHRAADPACGRRRSPASATTTSAGRHRLSGRLPAADPSSPIVSIVDVWTRSPADRPTRRPSRSRRCRSSKSTGAILLALDDLFLRSRREAETMLALAGERGRDPQHPHRPAHARSPGAQARLVERPTTLASLRSAVAHRTTPTSLGVTDALEAAEVRRAAARSGTARARPPATRLARTDAGTARAASARRARRRARVSATTTTRAHPWGSRCSRTDARRAHFEAARDPEPQRRRCSSGISRAGRGDDQIGARGSARSTAPQSDSAPTRAARRHGAWSPLRRPFAGVGYDSNATRHRCAG
jgi:hypothetical protein